MNTPAREIVAGQLSEFGLPTLLHTFSISRQVMALEVLGPAGEVSGRVILKGGKVVAATAGRATGTEALRKIMASSTRARFRVFHEGADVPRDVVPLGSVNELLATSSYGGDASRVRMMAGSLAEFDIGDVMQAMCIGRQNTELDVLGSDQEPIGTICLKAGKVVSAKAGTIEGMAAIHHLLDTPKRYQFAVYRNPADLRDEEPIGSVSDVLMRALGKTISPARGAGSDTARALTNNLLEGEEQPTAKRALLSDPSRVRIMEGALSDFDVPSLLQVANLGRQQVLLEVLDGYRLVGAIAVKAGMVLRATAGHLHGTGAMARIVESPGTFKFVMSRLTGPLDDVEPLGSLESVLLRAATSSELSADSGHLPRERSSAPPPAAAPPGAERTVDVAATRDRTGGQAPAASPGRGRRAWLVVPVVAGVLAAASLVARNASRERASPADVISAQPASPAVTSRPATAAVASPPTSPAETAPAPAADLPAAIDRTPVPPPRAALNVSNVAVAQALLRTLGHDPGPIDGIAGPRTAAAVRAFQTAEHLNPDGTLNAETRAALAQRGVVP